VQLVALDANTSAGQAPDDPCRFLARRIVLPTGRQTLVSVLNVQLDVQHESAVPFAAP
jgi:hypothetical protein